MSWQNTWGTVKSSTAKTCALYHEVSNVGKMVEASKKRVTWRLRVEEGKEYEITLTHSIASGKKVLRIDGIVKYTAKAMSFGDWDYVFNLPGGHVVHIIIKPSVDLNDMYDLIIDNVSFRRLPDRVDNGTARPKSYSTPSYHYQGYTGGQRGSITRGTSGNSRDGSFSNEAWECPHCTLVNEKGLAPVCEACGNPRPQGTVARNTSRATMESRERPAAAPPAPVSRSLSAQPTNRRPYQQETPPTTDFFGSDPFGKDAESTSTGFDQPASFDPFGHPSSTTSTSNAFSPHPVQAQDSMSMLSGLDFTAPATEIPASPSSYQDFTQPLPPAPVETPSERTNSGDLWESKMVDLNLNPTKAKPKTMSVKAHQTLEQARSTSSTKDKTPVMPVAPLAPTPQYYAPQATLAAPAGYYMGHTTSQSMHPGFGANAMVPYGLNMGTGGGMGMGMGGMTMQPNGFMTTAPSYGQPPSKPVQFHSNDPFATLS